MESSEVRHITVNGKYRIKIERIGSAKGTLGYTIEANGDNMDEVENDAATLKARAELLAGSPVSEPVREK